MTVSVKAPTSTTGSIQLNGSDVLTIDSSGNLTAPNNLTVTGSITGDGSGLTGVSAGKILQVVSTTKTNRFTTTSTSFINATDFAATITPSSTLSKILVIASTTGASNNADEPVHINLTRDGSSIYLGDAVNSAVRGSSNLVTPANTKAQSMSINYLDSPTTTSAVTYQIQIRSQAGAIVAIGGCVSTSTANVSSAAPSTITLMEVAG